MSSGVTGPSQGASATSGPFRDTEHGTWSDIVAFALLLSVVVAVISFSFGWNWIPVTFVGLLILSAVLAIRSRRGKAPAYYQQSVYLSTITFGILGAGVLIVEAIS